MKTQATHRNVITYNVTQFVIVPTVHHTRVVLDGPRLSSKRICLNDLF